MTDKVFQAVIDWIRHNDTLTLSDMLKMGYNCTQSIKVMAKLLEVGVIKDAGEGVFAVVADDEKINEVAICEGALKREFTPEQIEVFAKTFTGAQIDALKKIFHYEKTWGEGVQASDPAYSGAEYESLIRAGMVIEKDEQYYCTLDRGNFEELCDKFRDYTTQLRFERIKKRRDEFREAQRQASERKNASDEKGGLSSIVDEDDRRAIEEVLTSAAQKKEDEKSDFDALREQFEELKTKKTEVDGVFSAIFTDKNSAGILISVDENDTLLDLIKKAARKGGNSALVGILGGNSNLIKFLSSNEAEKEKCGKFFIEAGKVKIQLAWSSPVFEQCKVELRQVMEKKDGTEIRIVFCKE